MKLKISKSLRKIGNYVFCGCHKVTSVVIPDGVKIIGKYAFANNMSLVSVVIPNSVELVEEDAFSNCTQLDMSKFIDLLGNEAKDNN